jgi:hypothetical protein
LTKSERQWKAAIASWTLKQLGMCNFARIDLLDEFLLEGCLAYDLLKLHLQK